MTSEREGLAEEIARVLGEHHWGDDTARVGNVAVQCGCGWTAHDAASRIYALRERHDQHRADALADLLAARDRRVRAEALRTAALDLYAPVQGTVDGVRVVRLIDVTAWLRDEAMRQEADA